jgi:glycosyltransferase involved in cell wall biosynthesis
VEAAQRQVAPRILIACSGLDHAHRGFETFARDCFEALRASSVAEIELVKGSGPAATGEHSIPELRRDRLVARRVGRALGARPFRIEALSFGFALAARIRRRPPDVVFLSEWDTARVLSWMRALTGARFKLLLSNGSMAWRGFDHLDCVQELTPAAYEYVMSHGGEPERHVMLPLGFTIEPTLAVLPADERQALRVHLGVPLDRKVLVSVAALNRYHKRLHYTIEEVASLPEPRPYLLLLGQPEEETDGIRALAGARLGQSGYGIRTVSPPEVADLCRVSDAFVLASLYEGLPRALIEASALGLPCLVHEYPVTEFALGPLAISADLHRPGALAQLISDLSAADLAPERAVARHRYAYEHFSWDMLRPRYLRLLEDLAAGVAGAEPRVQLPRLGKLWRA